MCSSFPLHPVSLVVLPMEWLLPDAHRSTRYSVHPIKKGHSGTALLTQWIVNLAWWGFRQAVHILYSTHNYLYAI